MKRIGHDERKAGALAGAKPACGSAIHTFNHKRDQRGGQGFIRSLLPDPEGFYANQLMGLSGSGEWRHALCPFHRDRHPSFSVNMQTGGYVCFACGVRGGDVIDFYRARYQVSFIEAVKALGAWRA